MEQKKLPLASQRHPRTGYTLKFYGTRARSTLGCLCCRRRKKKCDEKYPTCSGCEKRDLKCEWPEKPKNGVKKTIAKTQSQPAKQDLQMTLTSPISPDSCIDPQLPLDHSISLSSKSSPDLFELFHLPYDNMLFGRALPQLDETGFEYLSHYSDAFCSSIPIGTDASNYFLKTFMHLAQSRDSILYALCAWGGFYLQLRDKSSIEYAKPWNYMQKAAKLICKEIGDNLTPSTNEDFFVLFAFYLIFIGIEVTTGDVCHWGGFMTQCSNLINSFGGLAAVCQMFSNNNDIKWLLHNFQFHDLLSSNALRKGTFIPIEEYKDVLKEDVDYGIDPLQGALGRVYNLFGEIGNAQVRLRRQWNELQDALPIINDERCIEYEDARRNYFEDVRATFKEFSVKIETCQPSELHLEILESNPFDLALQTKLFQLYVLICQIHLHTGVIHSPPASFQQQDLLFRALELIDELIETRMVVSLSLSLLVCGITCCTDYDRERMRERFKKAQSTYFVQNLTRIEETVEEAWVRNPDGSAVVDWAALAEEKGWNLYVG
ncbi:hypothetical_protein [Candidozyma auris]|uniref:hypothetical_protein n=1 Tax=Candidozyma auris TaxID=498019 RepID=UPI0012598DFE|nr:hypothetical_protein [[Candida] auris]QEO20561.1 hypothetical_protein [[Candida] auris]